MKLILQLDQFTAAQFRRLTAQYEGTLVGAAEGLIRAALDARLEPVRSKVPVGRQNAASKALTYAMGELGVATWAEIAQTPWAQSAKYAGVGLSPEFVETWIRSGHVKVVQDPDGPRYQLTGFPLPKKPAPPVELPELTE